LFYLVLFFSELNSGNQLLVSSTFLLEFVSARFKPVFLESTESYFY
jgi:hypothetical protein